MRCWWKCRTEIGWSLIRDAVVQIYPTHDSCHGQKIELGIASLAPNAVSSMFFMEQRSKPLSDSDIR